VLDAAADRIADFYRTFSDARVESFRAIASPDVHWQDPFADVRGVEKVLANMHKWSEVLSDIRFELKDRARHDRVLFLHMLMTFEVKRMPGRKQEIDYVKKVVFDEAGLVVDAKEYWDATPALESVPLLGRCVGLARRLMRRQLTVPS
jgi:steroid delta-isomerase